MWHGLLECLAGIRRQKDGDFAFLVAYFEVAVLGGATDDLNYFRAEVGGAWLAAAAAGAAGWSTLPQRCLDRRQDPRGGHGLGHGGSLVVYVEGGGQREAMKKPSLKGVQKRTPKVKGTISNSSSSAWMTTTVSLSESLACILACVGAALVKRGKKRHDE